MKTKAKAKTPKTESTRASNAFKIQYQPLYSRPYRRGIPSILILLLLGEIAGLICAAFWLQFDLGDYSYYDSYQETSGSLYKFLAILRWLLIPFLATVLSMTDIWCRWRRTLGPKRALCSAIAGFLGWGIYVSLGFLGGQENVSYAVFAAPGVVGCAVYAFLAGFAIRRGKRDRRKKEEGEGFELESVHGRHSSVARPRGGVAEEESVQRDSWGIPASFTTSSPSEQLPAYSGKPSHEREEYEQRNGWMGGVVEFERRVRSFDMPKEAAEREEELSFAGSSIRAGSSQLPTYSSSFSASLNSEDLRSVEEREEKGFR